MAHLYDTSLLIYPKCKQMLTLKAKQEEECKTALLQANTSSLAINVVIFGSLVTVQRTYVLNALNAVWFL